jgi:hypothetical protein
MKKLLSVIIFGSVFFIAMTASDRGFLQTGKDVSKRMISEHPYLTGIGSAYIGLDFIRSMRGQAPKYFMNVNYGNNTWSYFRDGQLMKTVTTPRTSRVFGRQRNFGAMLLGYSFYKTYKNKR